MKGFFLFTLMLIGYDSPIYDKFEVLKYVTWCELRVSSGNRTHGHNELVGGSFKSYHLMNEMALDIVKGSDCELTYKEIGHIAKRYFKGVIVYKDHIHVDQRKTPYYKNVTLPQF